MVSYIYMCVFYLSFLVMKQSSGKLYHPFPCINHPAFGGKAISSTLNPQSKLWGMDENRRIARSYAISCWFTKFNHVSVWIGYHPPSNVPPDIPPPRLQRRSFSVLLSVLKFYWRFLALFLSSEGGYGVLQSDDIAFGKNNVWSY